MLEIRSDVSIEDASMKIAVPIWNQRVAPVFDVAREILVAEMAMEKGPNRTRETLTGELPVQKALRLVELGVDILICGAISRPTLAMVTGYGIRVVPHVVGQATEVIQAWSQGRLESDPYRMPGCWRRGRHSLRGRKIAYEEENLMNGKIQGGRAAGGRGQGGKGRGKGGGGRAQGGPRSVPPGGTPGTQPVGFCFCPQCGRREPHERGVPCVMQQCPQCGVAMNRE